MLNAARSNRDIAMRGRAGIGLLAEGLHTCSTGIESVRTSAWPTVTLPIRWAGGARLPKRSSMLVRLLVAAVLAAAASPPSAALAAPREHLQVRVYVLDFDPIMNEGVALSTDRGWSDPLALDTEYRSDVAQASGGVVDQRIKRTSVIRGYPTKPGGFTFTNAQYLGCLVNATPGYCSALIDYAGVLNTSYDTRVGSACQALAEKRIDEVWLWGGPWFGYFESRIVAPQTLCPTVNRTFVVMGFSYERGIGEMLHDLGHRAEALVQAGIGFGLWDRFDGQRGRYAQDFACPAQPDATHPEVDATTAHAGNVHFPPNAYCHYQYDRDHSVLTDAYDWANFPNLTGRQTLVNASTWGATQAGFLVWWLGRFPRNRGFSDGVQHDWWRYVFPSSRGQPETRGSRHHSHRDQDEAREAD